MESSKSPEQTIETMSSREKVAALKQARMILEDFLESDDEHETMNSVEKRQDIEQAMRVLNSLEGEIHPLSEIIEDTMK
jgi:hypothetical protein